MILFNYTRIFLGQMPFKILYPLWMVSMKSAILQMLTIIIIMIGLGCTRYVPSLDFFKLPTETLISASYQLGLTKLHHSKHADISDFCQMVLILIQTTSTKDTKVLITPVTTSSLWPLLKIPGNIYKCRNWPRKWKRALKNGIISIAMTVHILSTWEHPKLKTLKKWKLVELLLSQLLLSGLKMTPRKRIWLNRKKWWSICIDYFIIFKVIFDYNI